MLTKTDLSDISKIVTSAIQTQVPPLIKAETGILKKEITKLSSKVNKLDSKVNKLDSKITRVEKNTMTIINFLDQDIMYTARRVDRIEKELHLPPLQ